MKTTLRRASSALLGGGKKDKPQADAEHAMYHFAEGEEAWIGDVQHEHDWAKGTVLSQAGVFLTVRMGSKRKAEQVDTRERGAYPTNPKPQPDMTGLYHINEPCILENLEKRSYTDEPYTFMGNVLVAVNPLKRIPDPPGALGTRKATQEPHPYAIAEFAFQQMSFAADRRKRTVESDALPNQSVVCGGESGSGKTESSKMVLRHLVQRTMNDQQAAQLSDLDERLLQSNPITEAFANASTLRNANSSRFGKLMSLHFSQLDTPRGEQARWKISAASINTYLLERSRVTLHEDGERNFHVFYLLVAGLDAPTQKALRLDAASKCGYRYLAALPSAAEVEWSAKDTEKELRKDDHKRFSELLEALITIGFSGQEVLAVWRVVAGVLHLGNAAFADEEVAEGDIARRVPMPHGYDPLAAAAEMLGVEEIDLENLLLERTLATRDGNIIVHRNASAASFARDAVAKSVYAALFDYVVARVNEALDETAGAEDRAALPTIGVLDIFGFESFKRNGFEQLLINFTNESLQSTFNRKVFQAELSLYQREGLVIDTSMTLPPGNEPAMGLLAGALKHPGSDDPSREDKDAILVDLDLQGGELNPSDDALLKLYNKKFAAHPNYCKVHPKVAHEEFRIKHYAGRVSYTVGAFMEKNNDSLPAEVNAILAGSKSPVLAPAFGALQREAAAAAAQHGKRPKPRSIVRNFRRQILELTGELDRTACSFVRCVKPNAGMFRGPGVGWFDRKYVAHQLKHLSIPQTAMVLRSGLPTRVAYSTLVDTYMSVLPTDATRRFRRDQGGKASVDGKLFVAALFWAFEVAPASYKMGHTKVFFRAGQIALLDKVLQDAGLWATSSDKAVKQARDRVVQRFRAYYARQRWRRALAKVIACNAFLRSLDHVRAAVKIQRTARMAAQRKKYLKRLERKHEVEAAEARAREEARKLEEELRHIEQEEHEKLQREMDRQRTLAAAKAKMLAEQAARAAAESVAAEDSSDGEEATNVADPRQAVMLRAATMRISADADDDDEDDMIEAAAAAGMPNRPAPADDEDEEDGVEDEEVHDDASETEEQRRERTAREIQEDAERATERAVKKLHDRGESVSPSRRQELLQKYENEYAALAAKYEARRQRNEALREDVSSFWMGISSKLGGAAKVVAHHSSRAAMGAVHAVLQHGPRAVLAERHAEALEKHPQYSALKGKVKALAADTQQLTESPRMQRAVGDVQDKIEEKAAAAALARTGSGPQALRKQRTLAGPQVRMNQSELEAPTESAKEQLRALAKLVEKGQISADEMAAMVKDVGRALERRSSRKYSADSAESLVQGAGKRSKPPSAQDWPGMPLPVQRGDFYVKLEDEVQQARNSETFAIESIFSLRCAWQAHDDKFCNGHWVVRVSGTNLAELGRAVMAGKAKAFPKAKKGAAPVPDFPGLRREAAKKAAGAEAGADKRRSVSRFLGRSHERDGSSAALIRQVSIQNMTADKYVGEVQDWLEQLMNVAAASHGKPKTDHPLFKLAFDHFFEVSDNIKRIRAAYKK